MPHFVYQEGILQTGYKTHIVPLKDVPKITLGETVVDNLKVIVDNFNIGTHCKVHSNYRVILNELLITSELQFQVEVPLNRHLGCPHPVSAELLFEPVVTYCKQRIERNKCHINHKGFPLQERVLPYAWHKWPDKL
ncbi:hypothetical protein SDC9_101165 [bioreactor metagenome]|uniref:Uncharacterized protein n=1 Tax=bioreactor metagenome TaxID=1076179 RepID=A0A645AMX3_9ZZZZ